MKISSSSIGMESERVYTSVRMDALRITGSKSVVNGAFLESLKNNADKASEEVEDKDNSEENKGDTLDFLKGKFNELSTIKAGHSFRTREDMMQKFRQMCINYILALLMGKKPDDMKNTCFEMPEGEYKQSPDMYVVSAVKSEEQHYFLEEENTSYKAKGKVLTEDGREIDFGLELNMSRSFEEYYETRTECVDIQRLLMDPLIINFDGDCSGVSDQKFYFDINSDGDKDYISKPSSGSGFLAFDKNDDGTINDGSELFGTESGDGFKDLARYDLDGNGWIDENDDIFDKLKIYAIDEDGNETLYTLKEKNVGAIYLGNVQTDFSMNNLKTNDVNAVVRKTGIFLYENGNAGTVQHVDLSVELGA